MNESSILSPERWLATLTGADPIVAGTLMLLLALSLLTWFLIAYKAAEQWWTGRANRRYLKSFWDSQDLALLHRMATASPSQGPLAQIAESGLTALSHYQAHQSGPPGAMGDFTDFLTRALRQCIQDRMMHFERGLGILATVGNTAPFIGLFGTVVGIMSALKGIAEIGAADLSVVAGPIGEALVATAGGIACAVPAVVGYNMYVRRLKVLANALDSFAYDLLARLTAEQAVRNNAGRRNTKVES